MKKLIFAILLVLLVTGCACQNQTIPYENGVTLSLPQEIKAHLLEGTAIPEKRFDYPGTLNVASFSTPDRYFLAGNDHYKVSEAMANHLATFGDHYINTSVQNQPNDDGYARFGAEKLPIDPPARYSTEIKRVAWDEFGTRYSYQFRTFTSGGTVYYTYSYTTNTTLIMEISLMVVKQDGKNKLALIPLPFDTRYEVGKNLQIDKLIKKDTYLDDQYYTFIYPPYLENLSLAEKETEVRNWYTTFCQGRNENGQFVITYLNQEFAIDFGQKKLSKTDKTEQDAFAIKYLGNANQ
jgi:hypothetical protein